MGIKLLIKKRSGQTKTSELKSLDDIFVTIGNDPSATVYLDDPGIALEQAVIINENEHFLLINRADGTKLNLESLQREERRVLSQGDELIIGNFLIDLSLNNENPLTEETQAETESTALAPTNGHKLQNQTQEGNFWNQHKNFAEILDTLRTEEDRYYFQIEIEGKPKQRLLIEEANMILGWDLTKRHLSLIPNIVVTPRATIRKDWSGVVIRPQGERTVWINGEELNRPVRLQNGDRLSLTTCDGFLSEMSAVFYEPTSMLILDSLLPQQLPPPIVPNTSVNEYEIKEDALVKIKERQPVINSRKKARAILGYFSLAEVAVMALGTLVTAFIIFLVLELSS